MRFLLVALLGFAACGDPQGFREELVPAFFGGYKQQVELANGGSTRLHLVAASFCETLPEIDSTTSKTSVKVEFKNCRRDGIETTGSLTQKFTLNHERLIIGSSLRGELRFKVIDPATNAVGDCRKRLKKNQIETCQVAMREETHDGVETTSGTFCGIKVDRFNRAVAQHSCEPTSLKP